MSAPPLAPQVYHITHVGNLPAIVGAGGLLSDAAMLARGGPHARIGMSRIKERRLQLPVHCHPGDMVGDYVPFYFCPRSIMLYVIHCRNHPELTYRDGQGPIVHLRANLHAVVQWAEACGRRWAFSLSNAGARYTSFHASLADLHRLDWQAISATDFRAPAVKDGKQAELLVRDSLPWRFIDRIGVHSLAIAEQVDDLLAGAGATHVPVVSVQPSWYY
jgi:ssDNA thymidine ADP-ribosyltransferase, DarT